MSQKIDNDLLNNDYLHGKYLLRTHPSIYSMSRLYKIIALYLLSLILARFIAIFYVHLHISFLCLKTIKKRYSVHYNNITLHLSHKGVEIDKISRGSKR